MQVPKSPVANHNYDIQMRKISPAPQMSVCLNNKPSTSGQMQPKPYMVRVKGKEKLR